MARPPILAKLSKGRIIDACPGFVDTFNYLVDFVANLAGDGDIAYGAPVRLDRTNDEHPVIRLDQSKISGGGGSSVTLDGPFAPVYGQDGETVTGFSAGFFQLGGFTYAVAAVTGLPVTTGFVCVRATVFSGTPTIDLVGYADISALQTAQGSLDYIIIPIYKLMNSKISMDLRRMPTAGPLELFSTPVP